MKPSTALVAAIALCVAGYSWAPMPVHGQAAPASPAAKVVKAAGRSNAVRHFATETPVRIVACSADGEHIAVAGDAKSSTVEILDGATGKRVLLLQTAAYGATSGEAVSALAYSADRAVLAIGTSAGRVELVEADTGRAIRSLVDVGDAKTKIKNVSSLAFSRDGGELAGCPAG